MAAATDNPCRPGGACCNAFRVSFHWSEASALSPYQVPEHLMTQVSPHNACMAGTHARLPRCAACQGNNHWLRAAPCIHPYPIPTRGMETTEMGS